jgi:hypothetical protein
MSNREARNAGSNDMLVLKGQGRGIDVVTGRTRLMLLLYSDNWGSACWQFGSNNDDATSGVQNVDRTHSNTPDHGH